jgi:hypothetical protein
MAGNFRARGDQIPKTSGAAKRAAPLVLGGPWRRGLARQRALEASPEPTSSREGSRGHAGRLPWAGLRWPTGEEKLVFQPGICYD